MLLNNSVEFYFKEKISSYTEKFYKKNESIDSYLSKMLTSKIRLVEKKYLFDLYKKCNENNDFQSYLNLAEHSLYISGFFTASLNNSTVGIPYYIDMGKTAYLQASKVCKIKENEMIFSSLSIDFEFYLNCLFSISKDSFNSDKLSFASQDIIILNPDLLRKKH